MEVLALKTVTERRIRDRVRNLFGADAKYPDPNLPYKERLNLVTAGYLLLPTDSNKGPLVRIKITDGSSVSDELDSDEGYEEDPDIEPTNAHSGIESMNIRIGGITALYNSPDDATEAQARLEELIRLRLKGMPLKGLCTAYSDGSLTYSGILKFAGNSFDEYQQAGDRAYPTISQPIAYSANTSTGTVVTGSDTVFEGQQDTAYAIRIHTANTTPGKLDGMKWQYGALNTLWSDPKDPSPAGQWTPMEAGVKLLFNLEKGQRFAEGDTWDFKCTPRTDLFAGIFYQNWTLTNFTQS